MAKKKKQTKKEKEEAKSVMEKAKSTIKKSAEFALIISGKKK